MSVGIRCRSQKRRRIARQHGLILGLGGRKSQGVDSKPLKIGTLAERSGAPAGRNSEGKARTSPLSAANPLDRVGNWGARSGSKSVAANRSARRTDLSKGWCKLGGMFCPRCGAEYRQGYMSCSDCHVFLVAARPSRTGAGLLWPPRADEEPGPDKRLAGSEAEYRGEAAPEPGDPSEDPFCSFWKGNDARVCAELCTVLDEAGIPHKTVHRSDHLFNLNNQVGYELGVPASLYEKAELAIKEAFGTSEDTVRLLPPPEEDARAKNLRNVWTGVNGPEYAAVSSELKNAGIYYRVEERRRQSLGEKLEERYEISVAEGDFDRAKEITGGIKYADSDEGDANESAEDSDARLEADDSEPNEPIRRVRDEHWCPEDATQLAWSGEPGECQDMIEMSLRENDVGMRWELRDGKPNLFVLPEDEARAKEIVREVIEGTPME